MVVFDPPPKPPPAGDEEDIMVGEPTGELLTGVILIPDWEGSGTGI